jgi:hypothetical protein
MTNYEKIKKACQIANPRLMELSFGCEVYCEQGYEDEKGNYHDEYGIVMDGPDDEGICSILANTEDENGYRILLPMLPTEILGHEPQLSDVLMALHYQKAEMEVEIKVLSGGRFKFWKEDYNKFGDFEETNTYFDLSKSVKDQSPETLQFIADLL